MEKFTFKKAFPVWKKGECLTKNYTCIFKARYYGNDTIISLSCVNFYQIYLNGKFVAYGPSRAAHDYLYVDSYKLSGKKRNEIIIIVESNNCYSFYGLNMRPFLIAEIETEKGIIYTGSKKFKCYDSYRITKSPRYSYQRPFTECYDYTKELVEVPQEKVKGLNYLKRLINYPNYNSVKARLIESGSFKIDNSLKIYENRCLTQENIGIYKLDELEINPNIFLSKLVYAKYDSNLKTIKEGEYSLYSLKNVKSGFININFESLSDSEIVVIFDHIDSRKNKNDNSPRIINYSRNDSLNFMYLKTNVGKYNFQSFEPYDYKYIKVIVKSGGINIKNVGCVTYENSDVREFMFKSSDSDYERIIDASMETFIQNSADLFTDCPGRERAGWLCDSYFIGKAEKLLTGFNRVEKEFLTNIALINKIDNIPNGMIPMCYPADFIDAQYIPNWAMFYVVELLDYKDRTNDLSLIELSKKKVYDLISFFKKYENEYSLLEDLDNWVFIEWSEAQSDAFLKNVSIPTNMLYAKMLYSAGVLFNDNELINKSNIIKEYIRNLSYDGLFFNDNLIRNDNNELVKSGLISETCQYYAFFSDVANTNDYSKLYNLLLKEFGPKRNEKKKYPNIIKSVPFIGCYLRMLIMLNNGCYNELLNDSKELFLPMAKKTGTLWEHGMAFASLNHGFASFAANLVICSLIGLKEIDENKKIIVIKNKELPCDFEIKLPISNECIYLKSLNSKLEVAAPKDYKVIYED